MSNVLLLDVEKLPHVNTRREGFVCVQERKTSIWACVSITELSSFCVRDTDDDDDDDDDDTRTELAELVVFIPLVPDPARLTTELLLLLLLALILPIGSSGSI